MRKQQQNEKQEIISIEIGLLLDAIYQKYGYDFRDYSYAHVQRRILSRIRSDSLDSVSMLQHKVLHDSSYAQFFFKDLSINVTEMFRDPYFYKSVRENVVQLLKTWSYIKIWHAGCSTGEEVYSMAILLQEEGLSDRTQIYATDFNQHVIQQAKEGIYPLKLMQKYSRNYQSSGARGDFANYFHAEYDSVIMDPALKKNIVWADHNLVTDSAFAEVQMIVCRNVLIYFNKVLQGKVHSLFHSSLVNGGVLCLGHKESLRFSACESHYNVIDKDQKIYRKNYGK